MPALWLIVADDLTGAADSAIPFVRAGASTAVVWDEAARAIDADVLSFDAATRGLPASAAAERHRCLLTVLPRDGRRLFKKIDSTLRGEPAAEVAAMLSVTGGRAICAPAFPALKRTTIAGRVVIEGKPLESTETWRREHSYPTADLAEILAGAGVAARNIPLDIIRRGQPLAGDGVLVCDAEDDSDLDRIVAAGSAAGRDPLWIGGAGLAYALARAEEQRPAAPLSPVAEKGGILIVAGSQARQTREAVARLCALPGVVSITVSPALLRGASEQTRARIAAGLAAGDVVVDVAGAEGMLDAEVADRLGGLAAEAAAGAIGGLIAAGGETAAAVLRHLGVTAIRLADEVEPGVPLGLTEGRLSVPVVTKAGAFGDDGTFVRALMRLREIRRRGAMR